MSHEPPVPPASQSTYPITEPPHARPALVSSVPPPAKEPVDGRLVGKLIAGGLAAGIAVGTAALFLSSRFESEDQPRATKSKAARKPPAKRASERATNPRVRIQRRKAAVRAAKPNAPATRTRRASTENKSQRGPQDASRISMSEDYEVRYWTKRFGVDENELQRAVDAVGNASAAVERELKNS